MKNPFKPDQKQLYRLFNRLLEGPITTTQIHDELLICCHTARLTNIRDKIEPMGYTIAKERVIGTLYRYSLQSII